MLRLVALCSRSGAQTVTSPNAASDSASARRFSEKTWQYACVATPEMMFALAIIDTGYLASGICAVFDRGSRRLLANENPVLPSLCASVERDKARLIGPGIDARIERK